MSSYDNASVRRQQLSWYKSLERWVSPCLLCRIGRISEPGSVWSTPHAATLRFAELSGGHSSGRVRAAGLAAVVRHIMISAATAFGRIVIDVYIVTQDNSVQIGVCMPRPNRIFTVVPSLPEALAPLRELAYNLWWSWNLDAVDLFRRLDRDLWEKAGHNPVLILGSISQERLEEAAVDDGFLAHMRRVYQTMIQYMESKDTWYQRNHARANPGQVIAYFSAEFGLNECLPVYSGGLGVLAGDHLKSSSDLDLPLIGVSLLYQEGYFRQYLNADGWQQESYPMNDFANMPMRLQRGAMINRAGRCRISCARLSRISEGPCCRDRYTCLIRTASISRKTV